MFTTAKKAFVGAVIPAAGVLIAGWLSGHHLDLVEAFDAFLIAVATGLGVYAAPNSPTGGVLPPR